MSTSTPEASTTNQPRAVARKTLRSRCYALGAMLLVVVCMAAWVRQGSAQSAGEIFLHVFVAGRPAVASQVNENFQTLKNEIEALKTEHEIVSDELQALQTANEGLSNEVRTLKSAVANTRVGIISAAGQFAANEQNAEGADSWIYTGSALGGCGPADAGRLLVVQNGPSQWDALCYCAQQWNDVYAWICLQK